ncbi:FecR family protein [Mangrovibacterium marinum]|uniref:FecR family protein n=1 Tax=Mangrovibacterium marinum TaxID=1639118 RepID=A0A2T5C1S9_9BACT|nr:FecR domain-containing protein [Mangrovibacterium marinum]PTN08601.1 FecR family protein [Mangrovibacterium marinum]
MKTQNEHTNPDWEKVEKLNSKLSVAWGESKEDIWAKMEAQMQRPKPKGRVIPLNRSVWQWAVAAVILVLLGSTAFMRFYTERAVVPAGEHRLVELPDGSFVQLNAGSEVRYHPYWWAFSREVQFAGEAYFEVEKGSRFQVESENGITTVLGTSFNIYARDANYRVTCLTGKVQVENAGQTCRVLLLPNEKAELVSNELRKQSVEAAQDISWISNRFTFTNRPLPEVFDEIERQYDVSIELPADLRFSYSGNFDKGSDVKQVLRYVCRPFNLNFKEEKNGVFRIEKNN